MGYPSLDWIGLNTVEDLSFMLEVLCQIFGSFGWNQGYLCCVFLPVNTILPWILTYFFRVQI